MPHPNTVPAEALPPETITTPNGYQRIRVPLRTETGTIVHADLLPVEAEALGRRIGRAGYSARQHNASQPPAATSTPAPDDLDDSELINALAAAVRRERGIWTEERISEQAERLGYHLDGLEPHEFLEQLTALGLLCRGRAGRYEA